MEGGDDGFTDDYIKEKNRKLLSESWGVTDRSGADAVLLRLLESARATGSAWDYSRAMSNLGFYYLAGYYTVTESLDRSLEDVYKRQVMRIPSIHPTGSSPP